MRDTVLGGGTRMVSNRNSRHNTPFFPLKISGDLEMDAPQTPSDWHKRLLRTFRPQHVGKVGVNVLPGIWYLTRSISISLRYHNIRPPRDHNELRRGPTLIS